MAENTVEITLRANVADFQQAIKAGVGTFTGQMREASRSASTQSERIKAAMGRIGVRPFADIEGAIRQLQTDYKTLAASGELSSRALTQANVRMREGIRALRSEQSGWVESLGRAQGELLATGAAMAGLVLVLRNATQEYLSFQKAMAAVNSIIEVSPERFGALSDQVRELSVRMGTDATQSAQALYEILSSGVSPDNSIAVLEQSIRAAVAGMTDTQTAARVGLAVINAYGKEIEDLGHVYDVLFQATKEGVTTLPELAASLGQVLPVAAGAHIPFEVLAAALAQLTLKGLGTSEAITALRGAIVALTSPTPAALEKMQELGVATGNFVETIRQLAALHLDPIALREILPDVEGRNAVLALTGSMNGLTDSIEGMQNAAGATDAAYAKLADTDTQSVEEFNAALDALKNQIGALVAAGTPALELLTQLAKGLTALPEPVKLVTLALAGATGGFLLYEGPLGRVIDALRLAISRFGGLGLALKVLRGTLIGGVFAFTATKLIEGISLWREHSKAVDEAEDRYRAFVHTQQLLQESTQDAADTQRLSTEQLKRLSGAELNAYAERVRAARDYYSSVRDLRSRQNARENGPTAEVDAQALAAAHEARLYREQLATLKGIFASREQAAIGHRQRLDAIKQEELQAIKKALAGEIKAFNEANDKLKAAQQQREQVAKAFKELEAELAAGPKTPDSELTVLDINRQFNAAQSAFDKGDLEGALKQLDRGREVIRALSEQGAASKQYFIGQTQRLAALADQVGAAQVKSAQDQVDKARKAIEGLVAKAQFLKTIEIGFDVNAAEQSAEALRARIKAILADNPLIVPVQIAKPEAGPSPADKRAAELLGIQHKATGGLIRGPGTGTSDSILSRLSNGEYVVRAAAVSKYGTNLLDAINQLSLPGYARGGLVDNLRIPSVASAAPAGSMGTPVHLHLGGQSYQVSAAPDVAAALAATVRREALKAGR